MAKATPLKEALKVFETKEGKDKSECEHVKLYGFMPPIQKMDASLSMLKECKKLSMSTNAIEKIQAVSGMDKLEILSLGRNQIKKIEGLDGVVDTLQELWISYNIIEKLNGVEKLKNLKVLWMSNNKVKDWAEIEKLKELPELEDLLMVGNPIYLDNMVPKEPDITIREFDWRTEVIKRLPNLKVLDGKDVTDAEQERAAAA